MTRARQFTPYRSESARVEPKPAKPSELLTEVASPAVGSTISPERQAVANYLSPQQLGSVLSAADRGDVLAYHTLASEIVEREPHLASVLSTRTLAVSGLPWVVEAATDSKHDKTIAEDVEQLVRTPAFEGLVVDMMSALLPGFAAVEVIWSRDASRWEPIRYEFRDPRHFVFDRDTLSKPRLRTSDSADGIELQPWKWILHTPKLRAGIPLQTGLVRPLLIAWVCKRFTLQQLLVFLETMSVPLKLGRFPSYMKEQKSELLSTLRRVGSDASAVIPSEMELTFIESKSASGNSGMFLANFEYWDRTISKVVLGASMSVDQGSSRAQAQVHDNVRQDIKVSDARAIAATLMRDLIIPFVTLNYGPQPAYPKVRIDTSEQEDLTALMSNVKTFVSLGGKVEASSLADRLGLPLPGKNAELLVPEKVAEQLAAPAPAQPPAAPTDTPPQLARVQARESAAREAGTGDVIDDLVDEALSDWRRVADPVIGEALRRVQAAESFEDAQRILTELEQDQGDVLDISALTRSLASLTFAGRGVGDQSDFPDGKPGKGAGDIA